MIDLILTGDNDEARQYVVYTFPNSPDLPKHIVSRVRQIEGLRGPFILHFMPSWDSVPYEERVQIIDWVNRDTVIQIGQKTKPGMIIVNKCDSCGRTSDGNSMSIRHRPGCEYLDRY